MVVVARQYIGAKLRRIADQEEAAFVATRWHRSLNQFSVAHILIGLQRSQVLACDCFSVGRAGQGIDAQHMRPLARLTRQASAFIEHGLDRSEEHTSELQSLMRTQFAVFSLKKKNKIKHKIT